MIVLLVIGVALLGAGFFSSGAAADATHTADDSLLGRLLASGALAVIGLGLVAVLVLVLLERVGILARAQAAIEAQARAGAQGAEAVGKLVAGGVL